MIILLPLTGKISKTTQRLFPIAFLLIVICCLFFVKTDSTYGRLLIYKISFQILEDNWLKGIGFDQFKSVYMYYQAEYFKLNNYTTKELLLADNTYYAFSEYFQLIIELGIRGLALVVAFF